MGLYDFNLYDLISRNASSFGQRPAWFEADDSDLLTFEAYKANVDRLAAALKRSGLKKGDRIGVLGKNSREFFLLYGAAAALGAIMLPINWRLAAAEVAFNLNDCQPVFLFVDQEYQKLVQGIRDQLVSVTTYVNLKADQGDYLSFLSLLDHSDAFVPEDVSSEDGFVIIHTAAVAGRPRGALLSHANVLCANLQFDYFMSLTTDDVNLNLLPLFHVGGLFIAYASFHAGALNVNMSRFDADKAVELIASKKVSVMFDFAPILSAILDKQAESGKDIRSLRAVTGLDTPETIERYQELTGGTFYSMYGQTETSCLATFGAFNDRPGSAGKMLPLADVTLVDEYDRPLPAGQVGEITVRGPMVFKGYWNLPEDNAYTFREGRHHTGDLGRFDADGFLWYAGRKAEKELIKPGGENVYPAEVEKVILQHPAIDKVVVFGVPDPKWKEGIKAVCQLKAGKSLEAADLIHFVGERIARYKKPQYVEFVETLDLLDDGTPDRAKIKQAHGGSQS